MVESVQPDAYCASPGEVYRRAARRLWYDTLSAPPDVLAEAVAVASRMDPTPGRVQAAGSFEDVSVSAVLRAALPATASGSLRPRLEWYTCRGAHFHNDAHYPDVLFGVWYLAGPPIDLVFARLAIRLRMHVGDAAVFDPFEPHAVLAPGSERYRRDDYVSAPVSVFLGFELALDEPVRITFMVAPPGKPESNLPVLSSAAAVHPETGTLYAAGHGTPL
ncbi:MAG: hypothetical protein RMK97_09085 [Sutterellaceae bacterium]|nr:hypothetical protein [Burkholderiaceae bacterium]MDW8430635.1 hypothetical protein [Sutterellaceae bacterium]